MTSSGLGTQQPIWWTRAQAIHETIARHAAHAGVATEEWSPPLERAIAILHQRFPTDDGTEAWATSRVQLAAGELNLGIASRRIDRIRRSISFADEAGGVRERVDRSLFAELAGETLGACELVGDRAAASRWAVSVIETVADFEDPASGPLAAQVAVNRTRHEIAGAAAAVADDAREIAARMQSVVHGVLSVPKREQFLVDLGALSSAVTAVFVAQGRRSCVAAVVDCGEWATVDLPGLALDAIGEHIRGAHLAHAAAETEERNRERLWKQARESLLRELSGRIAPLVPLLQGSARPIVLRLSGWLHATPLTSVVAAYLGHRRPVVSSLGVARWHPDVARPMRVTALAAPGDGLTIPHLPLAQADIDYIQELFGDTATSGTATIASVRRAFEQASFVAIAAHGSSSTNPANAYIMLDDATLTVAEIREIDLSGVHVALFAVCEGGAIDRTHPHHPFNIVTAAVAGGARSACGPMWRVPDSVASLYTRTFAASLAGGQAPTAAHSAAAAVVAANRGVCDIEMVAADERTAATLAQPIAR